ncbi:MAG: acyl-CoA dehydrogenase family protein, partial [Microbacteriaceae bacterium]
MTTAEPLGLDDTQRMLRDSVAAFVARHSGLDRMRGLRDREPGFERTAWSAMAENGWFGLLVPEADGGLGLGFAELRVVMEELGRGLVPEPFGPAAVLA